MKKHNVPPPVYFAACLVFSIAAHRLAPVAQVAGYPHRHVGGALIGSGAALAIWAIAMFKKKKTSILPHGKSSAIIAEGPFRLSRNPIYLGLTVILAGTAVALGSIIPFLAPAAFVAAMKKFYIQYEEKDLEETFGEEYLRYKKAVRRWM